MYSIAVLIAEALAKDPRAQPEDLRAAVMAQLSPSDYRAYLDQALLGYYIPRVINSKRNGLLAQVDRAPKQPHVASKMARLAQSGIWGDLLRQRIMLDGRWVFLDDATADDLRAQALKNWKAAQANLAAAERWNKYADVIEKLGVKKLGEITAEQAAASGLI